MLIEPALDRLDVIINKKKQPSHEEDDEVQSTNIQASHDLQADDLQAEAPQSTEESPLLGAQFRRSVFDHLWLAQSFWKMVYLAKY